MGLAVLSLAVLSLAVLSLAVLLFGGVAVLGGITMLFEHRTTVGLTAASSNTALVFYRVSNFLSQISCLTC